MFESLGVTSSQSNNRHTACDPDGHVPWKSRVKVAGLYCLVIGGGRPLTQDPRSNSRYSAASSCWSRALPCVGQLAGNVPEGVPLARCMSVYITRPACVAEPIGVLKVKSAGSP